MKLRKFGNWWIYLSIFKSSQQIRKLQFCKRILKTKGICLCADYSNHTSVKFCLLAILKPINDYDGYDYDYDNDYVSD